MNKRLLSQQSKWLRRIRNENPKLATDMLNLKLSWYSFKNADDGESTDLYIYDEIMPAWLVELFGSGVSAQGMIDELNSLSSSTLNVHINSPGGDLFEGIAIYNALVNHPAMVNVYVDAIAASAASIIAMAGDKCTMMVGSQLMIHDVMGMEMGNAAEMRAYADLLDKQSDNVASIYAARAGGEISEWRALMLAETWMFAPEAVELGLADEVYTKPKSADPEEEETVPDSETPEEETEEEEPTEPNMDEELENLMSRRHSLANRGYKYAGRNRAPSPIHDGNGHVIDYSEMINNMFAGKG